MAKTNAMNLTEGSVTKKLILFAFPILMTNLLQQLYNVADRVVVGQFAENGKTALAAIGSTGTANVLAITAPLPRIPPTAIHV